MKVDFTNKKTHMCMRHLSIDLSESIYTAVNDTVLPAVSGRICACIFISYLIERLDTQSGLASGRIYADALIRLCCLPCAYIF